MSLYAFLDKRLIYPLYYWRNGDSRLKHLASLERAQYLPVEQLQALQQHRLTRLLHHAYHQVPYYREVMQAGADTPLAQMPILTKALLQTHLMSLLASDVDRTQLKMLPVARPASRHVFIKILPIGNAAPPIKFVMIVGVVGILVNLTV